MMTIVNEANDSINKTFNHTKMNIANSATDSATTDKLTDAAISSINNDMIDATKKLASLADVDYFELLANIFDDDATECGEKVLKVLQPAKNIYEKGESIFNFFSRSWIRTKTVPQCFFFFRPLNFPFCWKSGFISFSLRIIKIKGTYRLKSKLSLRDCSESVCLRKHFSDEFCEESFQDAHKRIVLSRCGAFEESFPSRSGVHIFFGDFDTNMNHSFANINSLSSSIHWMKNISLSSHQYFHPSIA